MFANLDSNTIKILYIEDQEVATRGLKDLLSRYSEYKVECSKSLDEGNEQLQKENGYDVLLLDLCFYPAMDMDKAIDFMYKVRKEFPRTVVIIYSTIDHLRPKNIRAALDAGVSYIVKEDSSAEMLDSFIKIARTGNVVYSAALVAHFSGLLSKEAGQILTSIELEICRLISQERTNGQIAVLLKKGQPTIRDAIGNIMKKLGKVNRTGIAVWYKENYPNNP